MFEKYVDAMEIPQLLDRNGIEKTAEERKDVDKKIIDFIKTIRPNKDKEQYVHIILMGTKEGWGANNNGDTFPEKDLFHEGDDYGYRTFLNAGIFTSHRNKKKEKSLGNIVLAIKNIPMKRVELIERLDRDLCKLHDDDLNVYDRIEAGEILMKSMGVRVPHDVCTYCNNKAKTRADYCSHALNYMGKIMPNGIRISVDNPCPVGFDSSWVRNPAFRPASLVGVLKEKDGVSCLGNICVINTKSDKKEDMKKEAAVLPKIPPKREIDNTNSLDENVTTVDSVVKTAEFPPWAQEIINTSKPVQESVPAKKKGKPTKVVRKVTYRGIPVSIEVMSGDMRIGYNRGGKWKKRMGCHYGFIPSTEGHDGEEIDVYLKPGANKTSDVYVVHQMKNKDGTRSFDEDKIMLGFDSQYEAKSVFLQHMPEKYFGGIQTKSFEEFKNTLPSHEELEKRAQHILKEAFCCGPCCKEASMVKEVPATVSSLLSKVKVKNSLQSH